MIFLADTSDNLEDVSVEMGGITVGELITPLTGRTRKSDLFAIDNGAYSSFDAKRFIAILDRESEAKDKCLFVACPDVVGSARRTLEVFNGWYADLFGWKIALVAQDGQEDLPIPWSLIHAIFIGGTTEFKMSNKAAACIKAAKCLGKWVHVGRINTPARWEYFESLGVDSCDGTGLSRYSLMREKIYEDKIQPKLSFCEK